MNRPLESLLLLVILIVCAGFTLGLTYAPCYSSLCSEDFFPLPTRFHLVTFFGLLASIGAALLLRTYSPICRSFSESYLTNRRLPVLDKRISVGGLALTIWIVGITVASTGFWIDPEYSFWGLRANPLRWPDAQTRLTVTGIIGHHCDIFLGLVLIPVSRNSVLGRVFALHQSTLLYAHKLIAYGLFIVVLAHGAATYVSRYVSPPLSALYLRLSLCIPNVNHTPYILTVSNMSVLVQLEAYFKSDRVLQTFVATYAAADDDSPRKNAFNIDNPTLTAKQTETRGAYHSATLGTGMISFLLMLVIIVTALPVLRRRAYNTFYYAHVICSTLIFIGASIHASTDFYFLLPGLLLWTFDWGWRLFRGDTGIRKHVVGKLEDAGHGWYRISLPVSARALPDNESHASSAEGGKHSSHPLQSYYLNVPSISKVQNHAFTAAKIGSLDSGPVFLFQRAQSMAKKQKKLEKEWTWKAGAIASASNGEDETVDEHHNIDVRVEGPYIPLEADFRNADHIVCIVGGTGLTGAYSLTLWWLDHRSKDSNAQFTLLWTVRHRDTALLQEWRELEERVGQVGGGMQLQLHVSSESGRIDAVSALRSAFARSDEKSGVDGQKAWIYVSGPAGLLDSAEDACVVLASELRKARKARRDTGLTVDRTDHYIARWEV